MSDGEHKIKPFIVISVLLLLFSSGCTFEFYKSDESKIAGEWELVRVLSPYTSWKEGTVLTFFSDGKWDESSSMWGGGLWDIKDNKFRIMDQEGYVVESFDYNLSKGGEILKLDGMIFNRKIEINYKLPEKYFVSRWSVVYSKNSIYKKGDEISFYNDGRWCGNEVYNTALGWKNGTWRISDENYRFGGNKLYLMDLSGGVISIYDYYFSKRGEILELDGALEKIRLNKI